MIRVDIMYGCDKQLTTVEELAGDHLLCESWMCEASLFNVQ